MISLFGGGAGMVMKADVVYDAYKSVKSDDAKVVYMSPQGKTLNQKKVQELSKENHLIILCGHYEGIDQRIIDKIVDEEISIEDLPFSKDVNRKIYYDQSSLIEEFKKFGNEAPVVVIDYLQILAPFDLKMTDKQNVDKNITELKRLSRDFDIPILGISSFNRENYNAPVSMASFKESGAIEYSSDVLIGLQYQGWDYEEGEAETLRIKRLRRLKKDLWQKAKDLSSQDIQLKILKNRNGIKSELFFDFFPAFNYFRPRNEE